MTLEPWFRNIPSVMSYIRLQIFTLAVLGTSKVCEIYFGLTVRE
jgi:hypothetical protein